MADRVDVFTVSPSSLLKDDRQPVILWDRALPRTFVLTVTSLFALSGIAAIVLALFWSSAIGVICGIAILAYAALYFWSGRETAHVIVDAHGVTFRGHPSIAWDDVGEIEAPVLAPGNFVFASPFGWNGPRKGLVLRLNDPKYWVHTMSGTETIREASEFLPLMRDNPKLRPTAVSNDTPTSGRRMHLGRARLPRGYGK